MSDEKKPGLAWEDWDELAANPDALPLREDHLKLLRERMEHFRNHPEDVVPWEVVKARILASRRDV